MPLVIFGDLVHLWQVKNFNISVLKRYYILIYSIFLFLLFFENISSGFSQSVRNPQKIYFISDVQAPMAIEKVIWKAYRNEEARDSLFADVMRRHPEYVFLTGDLTSKGSSEKAWAPVDAFIAFLRGMSAKVYALAGNHEYMFGASKGMRLFKKRFSEEWLHGYTVHIDSVAFIMLNSNFKKLDKKEFSTQLKWYNAEMISLDANPAVKAIIVCSHHPPFSNSKEGGSSQQVADSIVPAYDKSKKAKLFISGHSHNLEYFSDSIGKHFLVIGGGGGIKKHVIRQSKRKNIDLLSQDVKPMFFYLIIEKKGDNLKLIARGFKKDFSFFELVVGNIELH